MVMISRMPILWPYQVKHCVKSVRLQSYSGLRIFPHSDWTRKDTEYLSIFSPNAGKFWPKISEYGHFLGSETNIKNLNLRESLLTSKG